MGVVDLETRIGKRVRKINLTATQAVDAVTRHDDPGAVGFNGHIAILGFRHGHFILPASATTAPDGQSQSGRRGGPPAFQQGTQLHGSSVGQRDHSLKE